MLWGPCLCVSFCCASGAFAVIFIHSFILGATVVLIPPSSQFVGHLATRLVPWMDLTIGGWLAPSTGWRVAGDTVEEKRRKKAEAHHNEGPSQRGRPFFAFRTPPLD